MDARRPAASFLFLALTGLTLATVASAQGAATAREPESSPAYAALSPGPGPDAVPDQAGGPLEVTAAERRVADARCGGAGPRVLVVRRGSAQGFGSPHEAVAGLEDGDLLWFCPGRHVLRQTLAVAGRRGLRVAGERASIVSLVDAPVLTFDRCESLLVQGLHVVHEIGSWCAENTMELSSCRNVVVSGCDLDGSGYFGLGLSQCDGVAVVESILRNSHVGFANWDSTGLVVKDNEFRDNESHFQQHSPAEWLESNVLGPEGRRESALMEVLKEPSFDCDKASTTTEHAICAHPSLRTADARMGHVYATLRAQLPAAARDDLKREQVAWLKARGGCAEDPLCLSRIYTTRIGALIDRLP